MRIQELKIQRALNKPWGYQPDRITIDVELATLRENCVLLANDVEHDITNPKTKPHIHVRVIFTGDNKGKRRFLLHSETNTWHEIFRTKLFHSLVGTLFISQNEYKEPETKFLNLCVKHWVKLLNP